MGEKTSKKSDLPLRILTGVLGASLLIFLIWFSAWTFVALVFCLAFLLLMEFYTLLKKAGIQTLAAYGVAIGIYYLVYQFIQTAVFSYPVHPWFAYVLEGSSLLAWLKVEGNALFLVRAMGTLQLLSLFVLFIIELFRAGEKPFQTIAFTFLGYVYIIYALDCLLKVGLVTEDYQFELPLGLFLLLWANDTGAYFAGRYLGKHKLYEKISPKKTWEGSLGGLLLAMATAFVLSQTVVLPFVSTHWYALAAVMVVFGSLGDLVESQLKRSLDLKDSGGALPGHGGFLDRFDGLLLASPFIYGYMQLVVMP